MLGSATKTEVFSHTHTNITSLDIESQPLGSVGNPPL
jgi:hypothetical protein